eukprot:1026888-Amphidinium_carterae.1
MAYLKADLLTDGEPATKALAEEIRKRVLKDGVELRVIIAPRYSSQTLGSVGKAQDLLARQVRTLRADFEQRYSPLKLTAASDLWPWLVRHSAWSQERFHVHATGQTSFEACFGVAYHGVVLRFGETAMFKWSAPSSKIGKAELRFQKGLFVGKHYATNEFLMMTHAGVFPSRTVKRLPLESQVDGALVLAARGL